LVEFIGHRTKQAEVMSLSSAFRFARFHDYICAASKKAGARSKEHISFLLPCICCAVQTLQTTNT
jgi:hypothetical protein